MQEAIGNTAGAIWRVLETEGELSLAQLKKAVKRKTPVFDWAVGWLAREDKIAITPEKRAPQAGQVGVSALDPDKNIWGIALP